MPKSQVALKIKGAKISPAGESVEKINFLHIELWPIARPVPYPKNARTVTSRAIDAVAASLKEFGWRQPIVVDAKGVIVAGHKRLLAAQKLGMTEVPVHVAAGLTDAQCKAYRLMDNRSNENSEWDMELLQAEMLELVGQIDVSLTGFEQGQIAELLRAESQGDPDAVPEMPGDAVSIAGDIWICGPHRVLCGDSSKEIPAALCAPAAARLLWTDPPYGVDYTGKTKDALKIKNDGRQGLEALLVPALANCAALLAPSSPFYIAHPAGPAQKVFWTSIPADWRVHQQLAWVKDSMVLGHSDYHYRHEGILYGYTAGVGRPGRGKHEGTRWFGSNAQTSVLEFARPKRSEEHPTMKPVDLIIRCLNNSSETGDIILDPFLGSGSTLIACDLTGRVCFGIELDPQYVDVIVARWEQMSGQKATLDGSGHTLDEVRAERAPKKAKAA
jgi:DNA modification methylase